MIRVYRQIFDLLDAGERRRFLLLMGLMVIVAFAEVLGISTVFVLLGVLARPGAIEESRALSWAYGTFGFTGIPAFQMALAAAVFAVVMAGLAVKAGGTYAIIRFSTMRTRAISGRLLAAYLHQPYAWFLTRNSADVSHRVLGEVDRLVNSVVVPSLRLLASALLSLAVVGFLLAVDPQVSILAALLMGGGYASIYVWLRRRLQRAGREMLERSGDRYRLTNEASGGFREVKLLGLEDSYLDRFDGAARRFADAMAILQIMGELPRFVLEALTFGVLLVLVFVLLLRSDGDLLAVIPTLGVFAFAVMRLLPALQQIYHGLASIRANTPALDLIHGDIMAARAGVQARPLAAPPGQRLALTRQLDLDGVGYAYPETGRAALEAVSLTVPARHTVGIVGGTGAGKTTLVDLILGLLVPQEGEIRVDGVAVTRETMRAWQRTVGYVPQSIYLTDDSVAANIAFGVPPEEIDRAAVERAARLAALHDFITADLPQGYDAIVGERGVRLSGGQRQRIGIARALYHDPTLLILDEATSALDTITERVVMEAVASIRNDKTVILIAHRLSTVRDCDTIFLMERGQLVARGTYDDLVAGNETFRRMAAGG
ncbi:MAG TPA: ABC transporter ATP-binding protein [Paracoccaceae bacterium]|nr:ABC transporter ATP-binding protein [Paracoccaceae bacterium]HMO70046.1 ABC transporter ATP-binding protein [Paracoccaceae bacterium]